MATTAIAVVIAGAMAFVEASNTEPSTEYQAISTVRVGHTESGIPDNPALAFLGGSSLADRGIQTHLQLIRGSAVLQRAALGLLTDPESGEQVEEVADAEGNDSQPSGEATAGSPSVSALADTLAAEISVRSIAGTDLIEVTLRGPTPELAESRSLAVVEAYKDFLKQEQIRSVEEAIAALEQRIRDAEAPSEVTPGTIASFQSLSRELATIVDILGGGAEQLQLLEFSISSTSIEEIAGGLAGGPQSGQVEPGAALLAMLEASAEALGRAGDEAEQGSKQLANAELVADLTSSAAALDAAGQPLNDIADLLTVVIEQQSESGGGGQFESSITELEQAAATLRTAMVNLDTATDSSSSLRTSINPLRSQISQIVVSVEQAVTELQSNGSASGNNAWQATLDEIGSHATVLNLIAGEIAEIRRTSGASATAAGRILIAEARIRDGASSLTAATETTTDEDFSVTDTLLRIRGRIGAVASASESVVGAIETSIDDGAQTDSDRQLLINHANGALSTLNSAVESLGALRQSTTSAQLYTAIIQAETKIRDTSSRLASALESATPPSGGGIAGQFDTLATRLKDDSQRIERTASLVAEAIDVADGTEVNRSYVSKSAERSATILAEAGDAITASIDSNLVATDTAPLSRSASTITDLSDHVEALAHVMTLRDRMTTSEMNYRLISERVEEIDESSDVEEVSAVVQETRLRSSAAATSLDALVQDLTALSALGFFDGDLTPTLLTERVSTAATLAQSLAAGVPELGGSNGAGQNGLAAARRELDALLLQPQETGISIVDTSVSLRTSGVVQSIAGGASLRILLGMFGGLVVGSVGAISIDFFDRKVRRETDFRAIFGPQMLGVLPRGLAKGNPHPPEVTDDGASVFAEAVHLATSRVADHMSSGTRTVMVSSAHAREGKTMLSINLARALKSRGLNILLVDGNLRKPDASLILNAQDYKGLATALSDGTDPAQYVVHAEGLDFLPAGETTLQPVELVSRRGLSTFLDQATENYDVVLVDGTPVLGFSETTAIAKSVGAVVLVARVGYSSKDSITEAVESLEAAGATLAGGVLNYVQPKTLQHLSHAGYGTGSREAGRRLREVVGQGLKRIQVWKN
ncbi:MAG: AAA family ATPase [Dehalococcoidia bacterium]